MHRIFIDFSIFEQQDFDGVTTSRQSASEASHYPLGASASETVGNEQNLHDSAVGEVNDNCRHP